MDASNFSDAERVRRGFLRIAESRDAVFSIGTRGRRRGEELGDRAGIDRKSSRPGLNREGGQTT